MKAAAALLVIVCVAAAGAQSPRRTILAIGAHAGDMELTTGQVLARQRRLGDRVVILHLTLGERGNSRMTPAEYGAQKRREAEEVARALGAEVIFAPYVDGELPNTEDARRYVADVIRRVRPTYVFTHARNSIHRDHSTTHAIVNDAVLLAALPATGTRQPGTPEPHRGVRLYYAENWEDMEGFQPYVFVDVSDVRDVWRDAVGRYEFVRGTISSFRYLEYYDALAVVRGAVAGKQRAVAFDIDPFGKRRVLDSLP